MGSDLILKLVEDQNCFDEHIDGLVDCLLSIVQFLVHGHVTEWLIQLNICLSAEKHHVGLMEEGLKLVDEDAYGVTSHLHLLVDEQHQIVHLLIAHQN